MKNNNPIILKILLKSIGLFFYPKVKGLSYCINCICMKMLLNILYSTNDKTGTFCKREPLMSFMKTNCVYDYYSTVIFKLKLCIMYNSDYKIF